MLVFVAAVEIKTPDKHVEAAIPVILGRGFNSLRLHLAPPRTERDPHVTLSGVACGFFFAHFPHHRPSVLAAGRMRPRRQPSLDLRQRLTAHAGLSASR